MWLSVTELYDGEAGYTSHQLIKVSGNTVRCSDVQEYYDNFTEAYLERTEAMNELYDQYGDDAWNQVEFVRAYCEVEKSLYENLGDAYTRAGATALNITVQHPDSIGGEPVDGEYVLEASGGEVLPDVGRGFEPYAYATQTEYERTLSEVYADAYDCDIDSVDEEYFDSSVVTEAWTSYSIDGTLVISDTSDSSTKAEITDAQLIDQNYEPAGDFELSESTFTLCEVAYETPWGVPEPGEDDVPGR